MATANGRPKNNVPAFIEDERPGNASGAWHVSSAKHWYAGSVDQVKIWWVLSGQGARVSADDSPLLRKPGPKGQSLRSLRLWASRAATSPWRKAESERVEIERAEA